MGKVYRAHDPILDRPVALKTVSPALLTGKDTLARFQREARAAARLQHPNIVTIYELGEVEGTHYIAMELVEGMDLGEAMAPPDRFTLEQKVRMVVDVCRGLDFAHKMGVVHRDVKPANIRLTRDGTVKILDFGIARFRGSETTDPNLTQAGMVLGTPSYLSPELVQGAKVDHHADMWAVGVILYEMLTGRRPFEAPTITSLIHRIVNEPLPTLDSKALHLPEALAAVATRALDKDPRVASPTSARWRGRCSPRSGRRPRRRRRSTPSCASAPTRPTSPRRGACSRRTTSRARSRPRSARSRWTTRAPASSRSSGVIEERLRAAATVRQRAARDAGRTPRARRSPPSRTPTTAADRAGPAGAARAARHGDPADAGGGRLPRARHLRRAAGHEGGGAVPGGRPAGGGRRGRRHPPLGPALAQPRPRAAHRPAPAHRPRRGGPLPRLLARRLAARLGPRGRGRAPVGHGEGRGGAGPPAPRRVGRDARLLARRRDARHGLARREPAPVGRRRRPGAARRGASSFVSPPASPPWPGRAEASGSSPATPPASCA